MLAYELYLKSITDDSSFAPAKPVKKVYVTFNPEFKIEFDEKTLEEYGGKTTPKTINTQQLFSSPLFNQKETNLPYFVTGGNDSKPYIEFFVTIKQDRISFEIGPKKEKLKFEWFPTLSESIFTGKDQIKLKLKKEEYFFENSKNSVFNEYVANDIIEQNGILSKNKMVKICTSCTQYILSKLRFDKETKIQHTLRFVILPNKKKIEFISQKKPTHNIITDSFTGKEDFLASENTMNAKFMSIDDPIFSINNRTNPNEYYSDLGIGVCSHTKIGFVETNWIYQPGLQWYFFDLDDPKKDFEKKGFGIYQQFEWILKELKLKNEAHQLKIICIKKDQKKMQVLIDTTVPTNILEEALKIETNLKNTKNLFEEVFIPQDKNKSWKNYVSIIQKVLFGKKMSKKQVLNTIIPNLRKKIFEYLDKKNPTNANNINEYLNKTKNVLFLLTEGGEKMNNKEEFAYTIGKIAGKYIQIKPKEEKNNSITSILTYSTYDIEKLKFIYSRVGLGTELSKDDAFKDKMRKCMNDNLTTMEINDSGEDYSYFFYRGVFEELNGGNSDE